MISRICRKIICPLANDLTACAMAVEKISKVCFSFAMVLLGIIGSLHAQTPLHDPNLHTASPEALQQLSNERLSLIPSFQMTSKSPLNDRHFDTVSAKRAIRGNSL